ncbi:MAG: hypothetical protein WCE68_08275 [Anaerolineales bacterium]
MEISVDRKLIHYGVVPFALAALLVLLAVIGHPYSPLTDAGQARLLTWDDWQWFKAEQQYAAERDTLRTDVDALAALLDKGPDPVSAQLLQERIIMHTASGLASLAPARAALLQAAQDVVNWSAGALDRDTAGTSLQSAGNLLK